MKKNLLVGQSGGPTAVINASLAGVVSYALKSGEYNDILGAINGIEGVFLENFISMARFSDTKRIDILKQTPSSFLGSCRKKLDANDELYEKIFSIFEKYNIGTFIYIGGNDSMDTVNKLGKYSADHSKGISIIGIPKTIDNDLALTDHTPGFASTAKHIANSIRQLYLDTSVYNLKSVIVAEIMGRNAGWLTAAAALANDDKITPVDIICLPEVPFDLDKFIEKVKKTMETKNSTIIAVSEGICDKNGNYMAANMNKRTATDGFSHAALGGVGKQIELEIASRLGIKTRSIEFSTLQRCNAETASLCDINEAFLQGEYGVKLAIEGENRVMVGLVREDTSEYKVNVTKFYVSEIANKEKKVPESMISKDGFGVTQEFIDYAKPLINGHPSIIYNNGIIDFEVR